MLDCMLGGVAACVDPDCRRSLKAMADLFALGRIQEDIMFRNDDYIAPEKVGCGCGWVWGWGAGGYCVDVVVVVGWGWGVLVGEQGASRKTYCLRNRQQRWGRW